MSLASTFVFTGGANVSVGSTPLAVQVAGPTVVITNIGIVTVYGSLGGSGSTTLSPVSYIQGLPAPAGAAGTTATGVSGVAIPPNGQAVLVAGSNTFLWLATLAGQGAVNVANGS